MQRPYDIPVPLHNDPAHPKSVTFEGNSVLRGCAAFKQALDGGGNAFLRIKNRRAGHQHVGASLHRQPRGLVVDAAVHFDLAIEAAFLDGLADDEFC